MLRHHAPAKCGPRSLVMQLGMPCGLHHVLNIALATLAAVSPLVWCAVATIQPLCLSTAAAKTLYWCSSSVTSGMTKRSMLTEVMGCGGTGVDVRRRRKG